MAMSVTQKNTKILSDDEVMGFLYKYAELVNNYSIDIDSYVNIIISELTLCIKSKYEIEILYKKLLKLMKRLQENISHFYDWKRMVDFIGEISPNTLDQTEYCYFEGMPETINDWLIKADSTLDYITKELDNYSERL